MSILVDKSATFTISIKYNPIKNAEGKDVGLNILPDDYSEECKEFCGEFISANYSQMSGLREECTVINHINEKAMLLLRPFRIMAISEFCLAWNLVDDEGEPLPINKEILENMFEHFIIEIYDRWETMLGSFNMSSEEGEI